MLLDMYKYIDNKLVSIESYMVKENQSYERKLILLQYANEI